MRIQSLFLVLCLTASGVEGQSYLHRFPNTSNDQFFSCILPMSGARAAVGGTAFVQSDRAVVVLLDDDGNVLWNRLYSGPPSSTWTANGFGETPDGAILTLFYSTSAQRVITSLARLSAQNGQVLSAQQLGNNERFAAYLDIRRSSDGFVLGGQVDDSNQKSCFSLMKTDLEGNILWQRSVRDSALEASISKVAVADDGSFWALGQAQSNFTTAEVVLLHFDPNGTLLNAFRMQPLAPGRKVSPISIDYQPGTGPVVGLYYFLDGPSTIQPLVVQCNTQGNVLWAKEVTTPPSTYQLPLVRRLSDGNLLVSCGSGGSPNLGVLLKLSPQGETLWARDFTANDGVEALLATEVDAADNVYGVGIVFAPLPALERKGFVFRTDDARFDSASCCSRSVGWLTAAVPFTTQPIALQPGYEAQPQPVALSQLPGTTSREVVCQSNPEPIITLSETVVCPGQCVRLALVPPSSDGAAFPFVAPGAQPQQGLIADSATVCFPNEGLYTISLDAGVCARSATQVRVRQLIPNAFTLSDSVVCPGACVSIVSSALSDTLSYVWVFQGASSDSVVTGPIPPAEVCYALAGMYTLQLTIEGCGTSAQTIEVSTRPFAVPNAFTPDGDDVNDIFSPLIDCPTGRYQLKVYNRWGQRVFTSDDLTEGWDGMQNGTPSVSDVYVWTLEFDDVHADGQVVRRLEHGHVTLIR